MKKIAKTELLSKRYQNEFFISFQTAKKALRKTRKALNLLVVPKAGLEPARRGLRLILSSLLKILLPINNLHNTL